MRIPLVLKSWPIWATVAYVVFTVIPALDAWMGLAERAGVFQMSAIGPNLDFAIEVWKAVVPLIGLLFIWAIWRNTAKATPIANAPTPSIEDRVSSPSVPLEFYMDRHDLNTRRGNLNWELEHLRNAVVSWTTFQSAPQVNRPLLRNIKRMVLMHPKSPGLDMLAGRQGQSLEQIQASIREATRIATEQGVNVRWTTEPTMDVTIHNPNEGDSWIRVEVSLPRLLAPSKPSIVINKADYPDLFQAIYDAWDQNWRHAVVPN